MVRASGWRDGMNAMFFIMIVREFTGNNLAEAKNYLDRLRAGETLELTPHNPEQSAEFVAKLLEFDVVEQAEVVAQNPGNQPLTSATLPEKEETAFVGYRGARDFHDGSILTVERIDDLVRVRIRGAEEQLFVAEFTGTRKVTSNRPEGMVLDALAEMRGQPPVRRFVFVNWESEWESEEEDDAALEIDAEQFRFYEETT